MQHTMRIGNHKSQAGLLEDLAKQLEGTDCFFFIGARIEADGKVIPMFFTGPGMGSVGARIGALAPGFVRVLLNFVEERLAETESPASSTIH